MGPLRERRYSLLLLLAGAATAGLGAYLRVSAEPGESRSAGYLLETTGWLLAVAGAFWQARAAGMLVLFDQSGVRRRAILSMLAGICAALVACAAASAVESDRHDALTRALAESGIVGGIGLGLAGFLSLAWALGMGYAAERIEKLSEEDW